MPWIFSDQFLNMEATNTSAQIVQYHQYILYVLMCEHRDPSVDHFLITIGYAGEWKSSTEDSRVGRLKLFLDHGLDTHTHTH